MQNLLTTRDLDNIRRIVREEIERVGFAPQPKDLRGNNSFAAVNAADSIRAGAVEPIGVAAPIGAAASAGTQTAAETAKAPASIRESIEQRDNRKIVEEIETALRKLGKSDDAFNRWFQQTHQSTMHWKQASLHVKRELLEKLKGWEKTA